MVFGLRFTFRLLSALMPSVMREQRHANPTEKKNRHAHSPSSASFCQRVTFSAPILFTEFCVSLWALSSLAIISLRNDINVLLLLTLRAVSLLCSKHYWSYGYYSPVISQAHQTNKLLSIVYFPVESPQFSQSLPFRESQSFITHVEPNHNALFCNPDITTHFLCHDFQIITLF